MKDIDHYRKVDLNRKRNFYEFCKKALQDSNNSYYLIIMKWGGNLSKIFGELLMLLKVIKAINSCIL